MKSDKPLTLAEAFKIELDACPILYEAAPSTCHLCHRTTECRCGVCFDCKDLILTDRVEVWEIANPSHRWPYVYRLGMPNEIRLPRA